MTMALQCNKNIVRRLLSTSPPPRKNGTNERILKIDEYRGEILLFLISAGYIFFLTATVPLFWEEQFYQTDYVQQPLVHWIKEIFFSLGMNNIFSASRPFDGLIFKILFSVTGYNYILMRFFKALLFGCFIVLIFSFIKRYMKNTLAAYSASLFIMCTLSLYIHTLVFAEPYLLTEILKLIIFFIFLKDYVSEKTSWFRQFFIGFLFLLSIRTYVPAYSTMGILILFVLIHNWKKLKEYAILFLFFFFTALPWPLTFRLGSQSMAFSPKIVSIKHFFLNDIFHYITTPLISLRDLYYKPFFALLTFFGVWCIFLFMTLFVFRSFLLNHFPRYFSKNEGNNLLEGVDTRMLTLFLTVWFFAEIPLWFILPEHATRYATSLLLPFSLLVTLMIVQVLRIVKSQYRFVVTIFVVALVSLAALTNLAYVFAFRAGWGSSFIAIEKVQDYIGTHKEGKTAALYYGLSVAEEYYPINKSNKEHEFIKDLFFIQVKDISDFDKQKLLLYKKEYDTIYVIKRVTSGDNALPNIDLDTFPFLKHVQTVEGTNPYDPFDFFLRHLVRIGFVKYMPNKIFIYRMDPDKKNHFQ